MKKPSEDLSLPVFETPSIPPRRLSMTEYMEFVQLAYKALPDKKRVLDRRLREGPTVRFSLIGK